MASHRLDVRAMLALSGLLCLLILEGLALTKSYIWAAPLLCVLLVMTASEFPLVPFLGAILLIRIVTDSSLSSTAIRHTGSLNLSGGIALLFILVAVGLLIRQHRGAWPSALVGFWLAIWTLVAVASHGASAETIREGVRELSIVCTATIVVNSRGVLNVATVTRLIQFVGVISAVVALYQLATHTGVRINGEVRSSGTFTHPNGAAMYFAIATVASLWRFFDRGRHLSDLCFTGIFAAAAIATFSLSGLAGLMGMLIAFSILRPGHFRLKLGCSAITAIIVIGFLATPLGQERLAKEATTNTSSEQKLSASTTSLGWRLFKWRTLINQWEGHPTFGEGLGATVAAEGAENAVAANVPHNEYLRYLVETGVVGLATLIWGLALLILALVRRRRLPASSSAATLAIAIVVGCLVDALADNTFLYTTTGYAAAILIAAVLSLPTRATAFVPIADISHA